MILEKCFTDEFISSRAGNNIDRKKVYEKVVYAFYLLEKIANLNYDFVFKGGTSLMLLLNTFNRFSVDIDILMKPKEQEGICNDVFSLKDEKFIDVEEDKRKPIDIIKRHFKFYFKSIYESNDEKDNPYILLDIVFDEMKYVSLTKHKINSHFVETDNPYLDVNIPSIDEMLGDKLTAFAPKTIGILYTRTNQLRSKHVEIIKQLYDVAKLFDNMSNLDLVKETYIKVANVQIKNRNLSLNYGDALKDSIEACKLIITQNKKKRDNESYAILKKGYEGFKHYTVNDFRFQELIINAVKVYILSISILYDDKFDEMDKPINTFIGRDWKYIRQNVGVKLYETLLKACLIENKHSN